MREVLLRDLGGFSYEVHRAAGAPHGGHRDIIEGKAERLAAIDEELRALEAAPRRDRPGGDRRPREPGIGGTCPACGELHGSRRRLVLALRHPAEPTAPAGAADEARDRAIADREAAERERAAAAQAAAARAGARADGAHRRAHSARRPSTRASTRRDRRRAAPAKPAAGDEPTTDLGDPVASERRP